MVGYSVRYRKKGCGTVCKFDSVYQGREFLCVLRLLPTLQATEMNLKREEVAEP